LLFLFYGGFIVEGKENFRAKREIQKTSWNIIFQSGEKYIFLRIKKVRINLFQTKILIFY
jgi:hypothetical protein